MKDEKYGVGKVFINNQGEEFEIIEKIDYRLRRIKFLNFDYEKIVSIININMGKVKNNLNEKYIVGKRFKTNEGCDIEIIEYIDEQNRKIKFIDSYNHEAIVTVTQIRLKNIKSPFHKSIFNVACFGLGEYNCTLHKNIYRIWFHMIERCYDKEIQKIHHTYKNCTVCDEWLNFQNFAEWYNNNYPYHIEGINFSLDKDILQQNIENKIYSSKTCILVPQRINNFMTNKQLKHNKSGYVGVSWKNKNNKWNANINDFETGKYINLGYFKTPEEASQAYQTARAINAEKAKQYLRDLNYLPESIIQLIK